MTVLRVGSRGPSVQLLQTALARAGFDPGVSDGYFGGATQRALKNFQKKHRLPADGIYGAGTHRAMMPWYLGYISHTVRSGDSLYRLASHYGSTLRAIETANPGVVPDDLHPEQTLVIPLGFDVVPEDISFTGALTGYCVRGLAARYPSIGVTELGRSVMGRPLYCLRLGSGPSTVFFSSAWHANEWITVPLLLKYAEELSRTASLGGELCSVPAAEILSRSTIYIAPCINPDGVDLVTGELQSGAHYLGARRIAENYPDIPFPEGWKANIAGTDLNLQFPADWERARSIKFAQGFVSPAPRDYVGPGPLSARESRAVYDFTLDIDPDLILAYHTQGEVIYWQYLDYEPEHSRAIADALSRASGYSVEQTPYESGFAGYKDWFISRFDRPGFTIEAGRGTNPLPISQFSEIYADNRCLLTTAALAAAQH